MKFFVVFLLLLSFSTITEAKKARSEQAKALFKYSHPCPSNGKNHGPCPGYVIDHITALDSVRHPMLIIIFVG